MAATGELPRATAEQLVNRLNQQAAAVSGVRYDDVALELKGPDVPLAGESLANSSLIAARPRLFLLSAGKNIRPDLVQVGSNDQELWLIVPTGVSEKQYLYCSHEEFPKAAAKLPVPIDPDWAMVALGLAGTDPDPSLYRVDTDFKRRQYTLTREVTTPGGRRVSRTVVFAADTQTGDRPQVREHLVTDPGGRTVIARATISTVHRPPELAAAEVPTDLTLEWPEQQFRMRLRMRNPVVNEPLDPARVKELFARPQVRGVEPINLATQVGLPGVQRGAAPTDARRGLFGRRRD